MNNRFQLAVTRSRAGSVVEDLPSHAGYDHDRVQRAELLLVVDAELGRATRFVAHSATVGEGEIPFDTGEALGLNSHTVDNVTSRRRVPLEREKVGSATHLVADGLGDTETQRIGHPFLTAHRDDLA